MTLDDLARLQEAFGDQMRHGEPALAALAPWLDADTATTRRFARYADALRHHHERSLKLVYPVLQALVGDGFFRTLARAYGDAHPSRDGDLARFGADLPAFIAGLPVLEPYPYLPDVARLEWLLHEAHGAADATALSVQDVQRADPDELGHWPLRLHPAAALFKSDWKAVDIWRAHTQPAGNALPATVEGSTHAVVHRAGWTAMVRETDDAEWAALARLSATATLGDALMAAHDIRTSRSNNAQLFDPATLFGIWLSNGLLVRA